MMQLYYTFPLCICQCQFNHFLYFDQIKFFVMIIKIPQTQFSIYKLISIYCNKECPLAWKMSLQKRQFNRTVCEILVYESMGKIASVPHEFSSTGVSEPVHCLLRVQNENEICLLEQIAAGEITSYIKKIIRKHIRKNITKPNTVSAELLLRFLYSVKARIENRKVFIQPECYILVRENYGHDLPSMLSPSTFRFGDSCLPNKIRAAEKLMLFCNPSQSIETRTRF